MAFLNTVEYSTKEHAEWLIYSIKKLNYDSLNKNEMNKLKQFVIRYITDLDLVFSRNI